MAVYLLLTLVLTAILAACVPPAGEPGVETPPTDTPTTDVNEPDTDDPEATLDWVVTPIWQLVQYGPAQNLSQVANPLIITYERGELVFVPQEEPEALPLEGTEWRLETAVTFHDDVMSALHFVCRRTRPKFGCRPLAGSGRGSDRRRTGCERPLPDKSRVAAGAVAAG
jgi:hypothetical protein